ncbi:MAG: fatty acyl-AMP ligase [Spirochaetes bacterium]|jgi:acyl-CoA synthetase (AMP-forming)/AMP-acid ligase II|nr:fatty acyl-AMP ligase [Spirochaetota bacterium]
MNSILIDSKLAHQKNTVAYTLKAKTLVESLESRLESKQDFLYMMDSRNREHPLPVPVIVEEARAVAQFLMARGLVKDDKVVVMLPTSADFVYIYFGILMAGGIPVPVSQPAGTNNLEKYIDNLKHIIANSEAKFFITYTKIKAIIAGMVDSSSIKGNFLFTSDIFENPVPKSSYRDYPELKSTDTALIQYTSGTTGMPKGVVLTHENLIHNIHGIGVASGMNDDYVGISWLPLYHDMGLIGGLFTCMYWGLKLVLMMPEAFLLKPLWWLENITKYRVTIAVAPNFGYHYCVSRISDEDICDLDLSSWRIALNGAEPIDRVTLMRFIDKFRSSGLRDDIFMPVYGMAENSLAATFPAMENPTVVRRFLRDALEEEHVAIDTDSDDIRVYVDLAAVGYPLLGQEVRIVDEHGNTRKEREVGQILVKSPSLTKGYYKNEKATQDAIRDGWLYTGDMGFIIDEMLFISGRMKELIIKRGKNIYPYDVERIAQTVKGVRLGCCAAFAVPNQNQGTEDLVMVCESLYEDRADLEELERNISREIVARLGISPDAILLVPKGTIPKTSSGKIQRVLCRRNYIEGRLIQSRKWNTVILLKTIIMSYLQLFRLKIGRLINVYEN